LGSTDLRTYSHGPSFFAGVDLASILKYWQRNTLTAKFTRDIHDALDEIRSYRYALESNIYITPNLMLTDTFTFSDYSDDNQSTDHYHILTLIITEKKPDFNVGFGYRWRDFDNDAALYYSPQDLESRIYSVFLGQGFDDNYLYGLFKLFDNNNHIDDYYYLVGSDYKLSDNSSIISEISYFDTEGKYHALTATVSLRLKF